MLERTKTMLASLARAGSAALLRLADRIQPAGGGGPIVVVKSAKK